MEKDQCASNPDSISSLMEQNDLLYLTKGRHATWLELFFDLIFVVGLGQVTHLLSGAHGGHITPNDWFEFFVAFIAIWWLWVGHTVYSNLLDSDTKFHRVITLLVIFLLIIGTTSLGAHEFLSVYFIVPYCLIRVIYCYMFYFGFHRKLSGEYKKVGMYGGLVGLCGAALTLLTLFLHGHWRGIVLLTLVFIEMILYLFRPYHENAPAADKEHLVERVGLLALIMLGESVISLVHGLTNVQWNPTSITTAIVGFVTVCLIWWVYFDSFDLLIKSKRDRNGSAILYSQLFTYMSFAILANMIGHAILLDISIAEYKWMAGIGVFVHFLGKQLAYFFNTPEYRWYIVRNTTIVYLLFGICLFFFNSELIILIGFTVSFFVYILLNRQAQLALYNKVYY